MFHAQHDQIFFRADPVQSYRVALWNNRNLTYLSTAVLVLYFKYFLLWDDDLATSIYHVFVAFCYLTPILGAIVADSWLGKFKWV